MGARVLHILFAFLLLVSSTGMPVSAHLCGGEVVNWKLFTHAANCGMAEVEQPSPVSGISKTPCCKDTFSFDKLDVQEYKVLATPAVSVQAFARTCDFYPSNLEVTWASTVRTLPETRPPPLLQTRRRAQLQVFLI